MSFIELSKERFSVRKFEQKKVEQAKIDLILEVARLAPTAVNYQPQRILVLDKEESYERFKQCTPYHFNAPLVFLICYDKISAWKDQSNKDNGFIDASIITTHMMYAAQELGLGSTWVGSFDYDKVRDLFEIPEYLEPAAFLVMGYPIKDIRPSKMHYDRLPLEKIAFVDSFAGIEPGEEHSRDH